MDVAVSRLLIVGSTRKGWGSVCAFAARSQVGEGAGGFCARWCGRCLSCSGGAGASESYALKGPSLCPCPYRQPKREGRVMPGLDAVGRTAFSGG